MSLLHLGLLSVFIALDILLLFYIWLYRKRTNQSKKLIGITAPEVSSAFLNGAFVSSILVLIASSLFLLLELFQLFSR